MKTILKVALLTPALILLFLVDAPPELPAPYLQLVPEAHAIFGVRRRAFRRGAIIGASVGASEEASAQKSQQAATAQQQSATAQQQSATAQQQSATAQQEAAQTQRAAAVPPPPAAAGKPLPLGTVVATLPAGCTSTPVGGIDYFYCGGNFYRAVFQGNNLVYVTAQP
jgi:hypothetical protein